VSLKEKFEKLLPVSLYATTWPKLLYEFRSSSELQTSTKV